MGICNSTRFLPVSKLTWFLGPVDQKTQAAGFELMIYRFLTSSCHKQVLDVDGRLKIAEWCIHLRQNRVKVVRLLMMREILFSGRARDSCSTVLVEFLCRTQDKLSGCKGCVVYCGSARSGVLMVLDFIRIHVIWFADHFCLRHQWMQGAPNANICWPRSRSFVFARRRCMAVFCACWSHCGNCYACAFIPNIPDAVESFSGFFFLRLCVWMSHALAETQNSHWFVFNTFL
jgi:hypothetical protein